MTTEEIAEMVRSWGETAFWCWKAGFDGVQVCCLPLPVLKRGCLRKGVDLGVNGADHFPFFGRGPINRSTVPTATF